MARPRKEIDQKQFENLCGLQCTKEEICGWFNISEKTLNSWCKRTYGQSFSLVFQQKRGNGKISLRRKQWALADENASMAIWLGKQYLGQREPESKPADKLIGAENNLLSAIMEAKEVGVDDLPEVE